MLGHAMAWPCIYVITEAAHLGQPHNISRKNPDQKVLYLVSAGAS